MTRTTFARLSFPYGYELCTLGPERMYTLSAVTTAVYGPVPAFSVVLVAAGGVAAGGAVDCCTAMAQ
jgi:hypothetical protein